jgi:hypothetical protein
VAKLLTEVSKKYDPAKCPEDVIGVGLTDMAAASRGIQLAGLAKSWAEAFRKRVTDAAFEDPDNSIPLGYKLTASYPVKILKAPELFQFLCHRFGEAVVQAEIKLPITNFDEVVSKAAPRGQKEAAVEQFRSDMTNAGLVENSTKPTLSLRMK